MNLPRAVQRENCRRSSTSTLARTVARLNCSTKLPIRASVDVCRQWSTTLLKCRHALRCIAGREAAERSQTTTTAVSRPAGTTANASGRGRASGTLSTAALRTASVRGNRTGTAIESGIESGIEIASGTGMQTASETVATMSQTSAGEHAVTGDQFKDRCRCPLLLCCCCAAIHLAHRLLQRSAQTACM